MTADFRASYQCACVENAPCDAHLAVAAEAAGYRLILMRAFSEPVTVLVSREQLRSELEEISSPYRREFALNVGENDGGRWGRIVLTPDAVDELLREVRR